MATQKERTAQDVVEEQCEAFHHLLKLRQHSTVRSNPTLLSHVDAALLAVKTANMNACALWFPREVRAESPLPPAA